MPVLAIGAAIIADIGAAGALAGGIGALTTVGALEVVGAVGATLGAIGAVTHDKGLSMAGMVLGGIGGIGSLAASAGLFGAGAATTPLFGAADAALDNVAVTGENAAAAGMLDTLGYSAGAGAGTDIIDSLTGVATSPPSAAPATGLGAPASSVATPPTPTGIINSSDVAGTNFGSAAQDSAAQSMLPSGAASTPGLNPAASAAASAPPTSNALASTTTPTPSVQAPVTPGVAAPAAPADPDLAPVTVTGVNAKADAILNPSVGSQIVDFAKQNPLLSYGLVQAAGSFISGATSTLTPAQVAALNAQAAQNQAAANMTKTQVTNMGQALPVASRTGIINSMPNVTGVAA